MILSLLFSKKQTSLQPMQEIAFAGNLTGGTFSFVVSSNFNRCPVERPVGY